MSGPWLSVVGIGEDGLAGLSESARVLVGEAEILIGGERHLAMVPDAGSAERMAWPSPLSVLVERIGPLRGKRTVILASGDPLNFGIAATLLRHLPAGEMTVLPHLSAFSLAAARLKWPLPAVATLTLHGRPVESLALHVHPGARLLALSEASAPAKVAAWLVTHGFGESRMTALCHMGGASEARIEALASKWRSDAPDLHTLAVECVAGPGARWWPRTAGLPDEAFVHDGKMTKREVRALALAKLMPHPGALLWDVGAGSGSISVEWMRAADRAIAIALEPQPARRDLAARNAAALGVPSLQIRDGHAPEALAGLPAPDAIFLGGGISAATISASLGALTPGGRLVAHAVTLETEATLLAAYAGHGGELVRLQVARAEPVGPFQGWRPAMPVTQWAWVKP
ncbi:precorrin-6Y C5,15-methyltransferase (decarboxylating) [Faunimonas pinastri]|uniref:Precorrin-6Y C5,15-methyltransferase (Decarboxylating) n=1 Tax=Faunimonas pinastri TaxID=1855383 RepID=A0A1H9LYE4_9HYPH|nr:precorrin-6y C5,15-methyltransferase (decarboxylating) subunit CbiE [Faunimonas pinastri]SER16446.1 precorrin-6Y C5,15-methyltransferase (decarboxylating) [Faunimonas pinastri]